MDSIFLLRAYGDCVVALTAARNSRRTGSFELIVSSHLAPLYHALPQEKLPSGLQVHFHDFGIRNNLMRCFTNKHLLHTGTLKELWALRNYIKKRGKKNGDHFFLENKKRAWIPGMITGTGFGAVINAEENAYDAYTRFFESQINEIPVHFSVVSGGLQVLLLPDARLKKRTFEPQLIEKIQRSFAGTGSTVTTAFFRQAPAGYRHKAMVYRDFNELVALIKDAGLVICADSLPAHLCQFLEKPHYIIYPEGIKKQFFTPFVLRNGYYYSFEELQQRSSFFPDPLS